MTARGPADLPSVPAEGAPGAQAATVDPEPASREEVGMRVSAEVVLFVGGAVLTAAVLAVFVPFMVRAWREDAARRAAKDRSRGRAP